MHGIVVGVGYSQLGSLCDAEDNIILLLANTIAASY